MKLCQALLNAISIVGLLVFTMRPSAAQTNIRPLKELVSDTSIWSSFKNATLDAKNTVEILPVDVAKAKEALYQTQVTTHSVMGSVIYFTGGILVDNGWIRVLGSGNSRLNRSLPDWNKGKTYNTIGEEPKFLLIADDVVGGFFALNGGPLGDEIGKVYYLAPDDLHWESMHIGYSEFIQFCLNGDLEKFYSNLRWTNWMKDVARIDGNAAFLAYPHLWTMEGRNINNDERKVVPVQDLYDFEISELAKMSK